MEAVMRQWGIPFHVIENEWTERQFRLFVERMNDRLKAEHKAAKPKRGGVTTAPYCEGL